MNGSWSFLLSLAVASCRLLLANLYNELEIKQINNSNPWVLVYITQMVFSQQVFIKHAALQEYSSTWDGEM